MVRKKDILDAARSTTNYDSSMFIREIPDVVNLDATNRLCLKMAGELGLPSSVAEKEHAESKPSTEVVEPYTPLNPLYDYQYSTGLFIRGMLEGTEIDADGREVKRKLIAVPTGSGKTRMVVETLIGWLNDGKPSSNTQQSDSKFVLWIAQSGELCEQALSTFRSVFESMGKRGTTLRLHRFWGPGGSLPKLGMEDMLDEKGVIIATIQSLLKVRDQPEQMQRLSRLTSCIIIDEAHHSTADSYSTVLRKMGFNWNNRKTEISEQGIVLIGLTATPFRGTGNNSETVMLERRLNGVYFPTIPYSEKVENFKPHALVDCQTFAYAGEHVRILGERSYDRDGFISDADYFWKVTHKMPRDCSPTGNGNGYEDEWTYEKKKNITFKFPVPGEYEITLKVTDNEGDSDTTVARIRIDEMREDESSKKERQKAIYQKLIKRKILCDVYHKILSSKCVELDSKDTAYLKQFGEFKKETIRSIGKDAERNRIILNDIHKLQKQGRKKILFFGCSVEHSRHIAMFLKIIYGMKVRYIDSKMDLDSRVSSIERFRSGDLEVLCNFDVLTTGFDAPNVDCVFVGRPVRSTLLYTQMIGRGMRGIKSGGTEDMLVVDIDDNFQLHDSGDASIAELGWKIYQRYWKPWNEPGDEPPRAVQPEEEASDVLSYSCSHCKIESIGVESIQKFFGIEGPPQILIECLKNGSHEKLPSKCRQCRMAEAGLEDVEDHAAPVGGDDAGQAEAGIDGRSSYRVDSWFRYLKDAAYLHVPTSRQFAESSRQDIIKIVNDLYGGYPDYLKTKGVSVYGDRFLEDKLYDEYFELYGIERRPISKEMLDGYGNYRIKDYEECFGTFERFENAAGEVLGRLKRVNPDIIPANVHRDFAHVAEQLGREPHFEELRMMSHLGAEYYVELFGSLGKIQAGRKKSQQAILAWRHAG